MNGRPLLTRARGAVAARGTARAPDQVRHGGWDLTWRYGHPVLQYRTLGIWYASSPGTPGFWASTTSGHVGQYGSEGAEVDLGRYPGGTVLTVRSSASEIEAAKRTALDALRTAVGR